MAENWSYSTPQPIGPTAGTLAVVGLVLRRWPDWVIRIVLKDEADRLFPFVYSGAAAQTLLTALNKANLTVKSLERRCIEQLVADGKIAAGSITGSPD